MFDGGVLFGSNEDDIVHGICDSLLGARIGEGTTRVVYPIHTSPDKVLKVAKGDTPKDNLIEFSVWEHMMETDEGKQWLAECCFMAGNGRAMVQERLDIFSSREDTRLPDKIPFFLMDTKVENWGVAKDGNVKCCDYALVKILQPNPWRMVKAKWWDKDSYT